MTDTDIRQIHGDEMLEIMYWLPSYAFGPSPPMPDRSKKEEIISSRLGVKYFALFEDGKPVACVASSPMMQNVRSTFFGMGGVWGVVTLPEARYKGYSKRLMASLLLSMREDRRPFSCLYPFRESFYQRLGYTTFPLQFKANLDPSVLSPILDMELMGEIEMVLYGDGFQEYCEFVQILQRHVHGWATFEHKNLAESQREKFWLAIARVDGHPEAMMVYNFTGDSPTQFHMQVVRFYYTTGVGRYLLLAWIARHIDQAKSVEIWLAPYEQPETWFADMQIETESLIRAPMGRVVDVSAINGMQVGQGGFSARILDSLCPWNEGVWRLENLEGFLRVAPGDRAECELNVQALSALVYGTHDPDDFYLRGWGNPPPKVRSHMRSMFSPQRPFLHAIY
jgi:predicted acetyltransferase